MNYIYSKETLYNLLAHLTQNQFAKRCKKVIQKKIYLHVLMKRKLGKAAQELGDKFAELALVIFMNHISNQ